LAPGSWHWYLAGQPDALKYIPSVKLIDRYVGGQLLVAFIMAVSVLTIVLVLGNIFKQLLDLIVKNDTPLELILSFLAYILPFSLAFTIPWAFLTAVLLVFGKMSAENELIAFRASGVSVTRVSFSVLVLALTCVGTCLWINIDVAPRANKKMKESLYNIATNNPLAMFGSDRVIDAFPNKKIYVQGNHGAELDNLLVYEIRDDNQLKKMIFAQRGQLETDHEKKELLLHIFDARYEARDDDDFDNLIKVKQGITMQESTYVISLEELHDKKKGTGLSGRTSAELLERMKNEDPNKSPKERAEDDSAARTEVSKRYSFSLSSFAFALIGVPLAITAHRKETLAGVLISLAVALVYFLFIIIANNVREKPGLHPELLMWVPNVLCVGGGSWLFFRMSRR
jgi:lipopolysaccharide export system permease protein